jgi:hypothetical protein
LAKPSAADRACDEVEAIEIACDHYKRHGRSSSELGKAEHEEAWEWEWSSALSTIEGVTVVERNGASLVHNGQGVPVPPFTTASDRVGIYDDNKGKQLIAKARAGDQVAHKVLCYFGAGFVKAGCEMPTRLREYVAAALRSEAKEAPIRRRGRDPYANNTRNFYIALTVLRVVSLGFDPTRNRATEAESACSITKKALERCGVKMKETNVEKIWAQFAKAFRKDVS